MTWDTFAEQWVQSCLDDEAVTRPQYILKHGASREDLQTVDLLAATLPSNHANTRDGSIAPSSCSSMPEEECDEAAPASTGSPLDSGAKSSISTDTATASDGASNTKASPAGAQAGVGNDGTPKEL